MGIHAEGVRLRGRRLQQRRAMWFAMNPLCVKCDASGRVSAATELDHILPLCKGGADDETNLQGLCDDCHKAKTSDDLGHHERTKFDPSGRVRW